MTKLIPLPGVLLAGGKSRRMGGKEKCLLPLAGRPLLDHVIERLRPQVATLIINAPGDPARFARWGLEVVPDAIEGFAGPLAGILAGLDWAYANAPQAAYIVTSPCDAPFLPGDLVKRLARTLKKEGADIACAVSANRNHPTFALWPLSLREDLRRAVVDEGVRRIQDWMLRCKVAPVDYPCDPIDPFTNINNPQDLAEAEEILSNLGSC
ncbi:MAG: molybdenum cofactor guanylyltransferase MobA [Rhodospirillales bacterium RIFCSPLOWO2_12_FULL_58_28]|nr:MAG: molybdenum cofactor guanylyltransferase MobA [Rhodospirillales bacterium RIFCSPLOWO2_02_FULL_58_16]OHC79922.1 MAG: molybdenum cofactor guanylyltransferase MobA [Rhodospirillales bacterium RIFCSPLOWO2_12_FULL_58_28]